MSRAPAVFISHGAPTIALEVDGYTYALKHFGRALQRPRAIVVVSAHWEVRGPVRIGSHPRPGLIYDFDGFPAALYALDYPAPGAPELAAEIARRLDAAGAACSLDASHGWDHGLWVPLRLLRPDADVPVVEVALPSPRKPEDLLAVGRALAPLRDEGVLILGSGGVVHNLRRLHWDSKEAPVQDWAAAFDAWVWDRLQGNDERALAAYRATAPHADLAVPTTEHFDPLFFALGSRLDGDRLVSIFEGFHYGTLSMRSFAWA